MVGLREARYDDRGGGRCSLVIRNSRIFDRIGDDDGDDDDDDVVVVVGASKSSSSAKKQSC